MNEKNIANQVSMLIHSLNDKKDMLSAVMAILAENKKAVDQIASDTKASVEPIIAQIKALDTQTQTSIQSALETLKTDTEVYIASIQQNNGLVKNDIEKAVKAQNDRAFKRLQTIIDGIKMPAKGKDGINANPADVVPLVMDLIKFPEFKLEATQVRDSLETLEGNDRLDASAIKGLPDYFKLAKRKGKDMLVGGIRFFENLADVSILPSKKRADLLAQYNATNNRWENGVALTVSLTQPTSPEVNDIWIDLN